MERLLHYVWKYRLFAESDLRMTDGQTVTVIDPGIHNTGSGPDFFNAKIRIGDTVWAGNVEMHTDAADWLRHGHDSDPAYDTVILHVVSRGDKPIYRIDGSAIPLAVLQIPPKIKANMEWLLSRTTGLPCANRLAEVGQLHRSAWLGALLTERLERKTSDIYGRLSQSGDDWNEAFYITLTRNFGFGTNSDAFEWLARSLPYKYIAKQRSNSLQIEALLFGQAGMLTDHKPDNYYRTLQREYEFLQKKYDLKPLDAFLFKKLRNRPVNFPHLRLAQLAAVWVHNETLFSKLLNEESVDTLRCYFDLPLSEYWETHYHFDYASPARKKSVGYSATLSILINTVVPVLFAYGRKKNLPMCEIRALQLLEQLPPEQNSIVRGFADAGLQPRNAADTQALIQLRREYCDLRRCLHCRIGFHLIKHAE